MKIINRSDTIVKYKNYTIYSVSVATADGSVAFGVASEDRTFYFGANYEIHERENEEVKKAFKIFKEYLQNYPEALI